MSAWCIRLGLGSLLSWIALAGLLPTAAEATPTALQRIKVILENGMRGDPSSGYRTMEKDYDRMASGIDLSRLAGQLDDHTSAPAKALSQMHMAWPGFSKTTGKITHKDGIVLEASKPGDWRVTVPLPNQLLVTRRVSQPGPASKWLIQAIGKSNKSFVITKGQAIYRASFFFSERGLKDLVVWTKTKARSRNASRSTNRGMTL